MEPTAEDRQPKPKKFLTAMEISEILGWREKLDEMETAEEEQ